MGLRAIFLDVGNTLVHEVPSRFEIYARAARRRGHEIDTATMRGLMHDAHHALPDRVDGAFRYSDGWFQAYISHIFVGELGLDAGEVAPITRELFDRFEDPATFRLYDGARELVAELRAEGLVVGVISNWSARLPRVLAGLELTDAFDFVLCSAIEELEKPDPAIFHRALERAGCDASTCLHAGDHPDKDAAAARAVGIRPVLVDHADALDDGPFPRVRSLDELRRHILDGSPTARR